MPISTTMDWLALQIYWRFSPTGVPARNPHHKPLTHNTSVCTGVLLLMEKSAPSESLGNTRSKDALKALDESSPNNFTCEPLQVAGFTPVHNHRLNVEEIDDTDGFAIGRVAANIHAKVIAIFA